VRRLWRDWTAVVEMFARREAYGRITPEEYAALHGELRRTLAGMLDGPERAYYEGLAKMAAPWLSIDVLENADREILLNLLVRCREIQRQLGIHRPIVVLRRWARRTLGLLALLALILLGFRMADSVLFPVWRWMKEEFIILRWALRRSGDVPWFVLLGAIVILVGMYVLSRTARR
jgi:hypothetical protein